MKKSSLLHLLLMFCTIHYAGAQHALNNTPTYLGFTLGMGGGFDSFNTGLISEKNEEIKCSTGGGIALGISAGIPVTGRWMVGGEVNYQLTSLDPPVSNADGGFRHTNIILSGKYFFPIGLKGNGIMVGAGPVFSLHNNYELNAEKVPDGANIKAAYSNGTGAVIATDFMLSRGKNRVGFLFGIRYTAISYSMENFSIGEITVDANDWRLNNLESGFRKPDGSAIDVTVSLVYTL